MNKYEQQKIGHIINHRTSPRFCKQNRTTNSGDESFVFQVGFSKNDVAHIFNVTDIYGIFLVFQ